MHAIENPSARVKFHVGKDTFTNFTDDVYSRCTVDARELVIDRLRASSIVMQYSLHIHIDVHYMLIHFY